MYHTCVRFVSHLTMPHVFDFKVECIMLEYNVSHLTVSYLSIIIKFWLDCLTK